MRMHKGKVISCVVIVSTQIAISRDVGIYATCKHKESIEFSEKLVSVCFELRDIVHKCHK